MTSSQNVLTPGYVNYPEFFPALAFPLWIIPNLSDAQGCDCRLSDGASSIMMAAT
jgi:hypothetical protein